MINRHGDRPRRSLSARTKDFRRAGWETCPTSFSAGIEPAGAEPGGGAGDEHQVERQEEILAATAFSDEGEVPQARILAACDFSRRKAKRFLRGPAFDGVGDEVGAHDRTDEAKRRPAS